MKKEILLEIISALLITLFLYAALSKLLDYDRSKGEMLNQVFPIWMAELLTWLVPMVELIIAALLIFPKTQRIGFVCSGILLSLFSLYIATAMTGIYGRIPCSCGGILSRMGYGTHLAFNLFFILISLVGLKKTPPFTSRFNVKGGKHRH